MWPVSAVTLAALILASCGSAEPAVSLPYNLADDLAAARVQPTVPPDVVRTAEVPVNGTPERALLMTSPSRVTWSVRFAERVEIEATVALLPGDDPIAPAGVTVRIGISDDRTYDELLRRLLEPQPGAAPEWHSIRLDLSPYSGSKWSLFYRPSRITWKLIVNADSTPGGVVAWRALRIKRTS